jgi:hypothetical protein
VITVVIGIKARFVHVGEVHVGHSLCVRCCLYATCYKGVRKRAAGLRHWRILPDAAAAVHGCMMTCPIVHVGELFLGVPGTNKRSTFMNSG